MRIAISNPDTMGDLILRQPLYRALVECGHELLLLTRPEFFCIANYIAPTAFILEIPFNPYDPGPSAVHAEAVHSLAQQVAAWQPDVLAFAPWQWTRFDEWLSSELSEVPVIGLTGRCEGDLTGASRQAFIRRIEADVDLHESEKNRRLAGAFGASIPADQRPSIRPSPSSSASALQVLKQVGLEPGNYWIATVGEKESRISHLRNWTLGRWADALLHGVRKHGWRYLLVGTPEEFPAMRRVRELAGSPAEIVTQDIPLDTHALIGLTAFSQGYMGRDTGPMHLAAALDRPILALFGGGHWSRFTPVAKAAIVLTMDVPCTRCGWDCMFSDSYCIKEVPLDAVTFAMDDLANGMEGVDVRVLRRDPTIVGRMEREAVVRLQADRALQNALRAEVSRSHQDKSTLAGMVEQSQQKLEGLGTELEEVQARAEGLRTELNHSRMQIQELLSSRWRKLGRALGIVKSASSERVR